MSFDCPFGHHATHNRPLICRDRLRTEETRAVRHALLVAAVAFVAFTAAGTVATVFSPTGPALVAALER